MESSSWRTWPLRTKRGGEGLEADAEAGRGAVVIDLGSGFFKAGYGSDEAPRLVGETIVAKYKERKGNPPRTFLLAGDDTLADVYARNPINNKSPFDGDVLVNWDCLENLLDYVFLRLKLDGNDGTIGRDIVMTEGLGAPLQSRKGRLPANPLAGCSELLFELYGAPSVAYGIDSLFSCKANNCQDGLVLSSGHTSTSIMPVYQGRGILSQARKIRWGGAQAAEYLLRLLQLKYPTFPSKVSAYEAQGLLWDHCYVAQDYDQEVARLADPDLSVVGSLDRVIQYPFVAPVVEEKTEEEIARLNEMRRLAGQRLQEMAAKKRAEKTAQREEQLAALEELQSLKGSMKPRDYLERLETEGFESEGKLESAIKELGKILRRSRHKEADVSDDEKEMPSFPLLDVPDTELDPESLQKKRMQRLLKAGLEARARIREEKAVEKAKEAELKRLDEEARINDPEKWVGAIRTQYQTLLQRIKERKRLKAQLSDRRSHASQMRMKSLANLASDAPSVKRKRKEVNEDTFGANDDDWAVYRDIRNHDSEDEEEDESQLQALEGQLLEHDPAFTQESTLAALQASKGVLFTRFLRGVYPPWDPTSYEQQHQLHLNVERVRVPEVLFQPGLAGVDQAGVVEIIDNLLHPKSPIASMTEAIRSKLYLTGGHTLYPGLKARLETALRRSYPSEATFTVSASPQSAMIEAWQGMARWSAGPEYQQVKVTKADYEEFGGEYIKPSTVSNLYHR